MSNCRKSKVFESESLSREKQFRLIEKWREGARAFFYEFNYSRRLSISHIRPARSISKLEFPLSLWSFVAKYGFSAWGKLQCAQARNTKDLISKNFSVKYILGRIDKMAAAMLALDFRNKSHLPLFPVKHNEEKQGHEQ